MTSVAMSPPKLTSTTISSASKSSCALTAASPHCAGLPLVLRSARTRESAVVEQRRGHNADLIAAAGRIDANGHLLDRILCDLIMDHLVVFEQRIERIEDHCALQLLPAQSRTFL